MMAERLSGSTGRPYLQLAYPGAGLSPAAGLPTGKEDR